MVAASTGFVWIAFALVISCVVLAKKHLIYSYYLKARYGSSALSQSLKRSVHLIGFSNVLIYHFYILLFSFIADFQ